MRIYRIIPPAVVALSIGCHRAAPSLGAAADSKSPPGFDAAAIAEGDSLFNARSCRRCHGIGGTGTANGPSLVSGRWLHGDGSIDAIVRTIERGVPPNEIRNPAFTLDMHPNPSNFTPSQIRSVAAYVWTLSRGRAAKTTPAKP